MGLSDWESNEDTGLNAHVVPVEEEIVLQQRAYVLFYSRVVTPQPVAAGNPAGPAVAAAALMTAAERRIQEACTTGEAALARASSAGSQSTPSGSAAGADSADSEAPANRPLEGGDGGAVS